MKSYMYQMVNLETTKDRDLIEFLEKLKKSRGATAYVKQAIREKIRRESEQPPETA